MASSTHVDGFPAFSQTSKEVASLKETVDTVVSADASKPKVSHVDNSGTESADAPEAQPELEETPPSPPEPALLLAVFGWDATPYVAPGQPPSPAFSTISRSTTPHISSRAPTPSPVSTLNHRHSLSLSRASGQPYSSAVRVAHRQSMPPSASNTSIPDQLGQIVKPSSIRTLSGGSASLAESTRGTTKRNTSGGSTSLSGVPEVQGVTSVVHCQLCLRRVGLWSFRPNDSSVTVADGASAVATTEEGGRGRSLDVVKEHRPYCPYVTKSSIVPAPVFSSPSQLSRTGSVGSSNSLRRSLSNVLSPTSSSGRKSLDHNGPVEGWRAILVVVGRSNLGMRFRRTGTTTQPSAMRERGGKDGRPHVGRSGSVSFAVPENPPSPSDKALQDTRMGSPPRLDADSTSDPGMDVDHAETETAEGGVEKVVENVRKTKEGVSAFLKSPSPPFHPNVFRAGSSSNTSKISSEEEIRPLLPVPLPKPHPEPVFVWEAEISLQLHHEWHLQRQVPLLRCK